MSELRDHPVLPPELAPREGTYFTVQRHRAARPSRRRGRWVGVSVLVTVLALAIAAGPSVMGYGFQSLDSLSLPAASVGLDRAELETRLAAVRPSAPWIVIDTVGNRLTLRDEKSFLHDAVCSVGTGAILEEPESQRRWVFDTPKGRHRVLTKKRNPVWHKPDWAFIEEGEPIPSDPAKRIDRTALGRFALYFGDGYLIHGTLYERLLGRSVTHGCIRLGDEDLETVYERTPHGSSIYIF